MPVKLICICDMVLSQFPQSGAEQKQVIDFSAKTAIPKLFKLKLCTTCFCSKFWRLKKRFRL
jgi:hypothetical protein